MQIGALKHRIEIGYYAEGTNQWGDPLTEPAWNLIDKAWASVEGLRGNQYFQAQQTINQSDHRIIVRYRQGVQPGLIVRHANREFTVQSVLDEEGTKRWLTMICQEVKLS